MVATPQTGIDSILATYGVLGVPILIFKLIVALLSGLVAGSLSDIYDRDKEERKEQHVQMNVVMMKKTSF